MKFVASVTPGWTDDNFTANSVTLNLGATKATDLESVKVYTSANDDFVSNGQRSATLVGTASAITDNVVTVKFTDGVTFKENQRFYVTANIKSDATVGNKFDVAITGLTYNTDKRPLSPRATPKAKVSSIRYRAHPSSPMISVHTTGAFLPW